MTIRNFNRLPLALASLTCLFASGCASSFVLKETPPSFIEVEFDDWAGEAELRMKAPDNVGINITTEDNFRGGTLVLWAEDLVRKLSERGYLLMRQEEVRSKNGVPGTRFDFSYTPPGGEEQARFYTAILFVTDEWRVIAQIAGLASLEADHQQDIEKVLREIKITGCKSKTDVCKSPQPRRFETAQPVKANTAPDESGQDDGGNEGDSAGSEAPAEVEPEVTPGAAASE